MCVLLIGALCFAIPLRSTRAASAGDLRCMISDGQVDILNVARLYAHIKQTDIITDPVALKAADYTGDGVINIVDVGKLYICTKNA